MKKYTRPTVEIVELESRNNIADVNPLNASSFEATDGTITTVYNLALMSGTSLGNPNTPSA